MKDTTNKPTIYFDLDGTLYDLYGQADWLARITTLADPSAYAADAPLVDVDALHTTLDALVAEGYAIGVVSWLAKDSSKSYDTAVRRVKRDWVKRYLPQATEVHVVRYGTPKHRVVRDRYGILVDDDPQVRATWKGVAVGVDNILSDLLCLVE